MEPPDPIPNSEVKRFSADGSVGSPHVRVGHCQALNTNTLISNDQGIFLSAEWGLGPCPKHMWLAPRAIASVSAIAPALL